MAASFLKRSLLSLAVAMPLAATADDVDNAQLARQCPAGTHFVGTSQETQGDTVVVHPRCKRDVAPAPNPTNDADVQRGIDAEKARMERQRQLQQALDKLKSMQEQVEKCLASSSMDPQCEPTRQMVPAVTSVRG